MSRFVFDSYAILALARQEPSASRVTTLLDDPRHQHWMSAINVGEVYYRTARMKGLHEANRVLARMESLPIRILGASLKTAVDAARIKAAYSIAYADCFAAAIAADLQARVVTGDPEFELLERDRIVAIEWLQPKLRRLR